MISPGDPSGTPPASAIDGIGASRTGMTLTSIPGRTRPTQAPLTEEGSISSADTVLTGRASVAPYGLWRRPPVRKERDASQSSAGTGAPAHRTRRRLGRV